MNSTSNDSNSFSAAQQQLALLNETIGHYVVGQDALVKQLLVAMASGGHVLLEGLPGLGKTQLTRVMAACLGLAMNRIQCTPDLMPADITGSETLRGGDLQRVEFRQGPVFANLVLVDEINRATPRTQSALLEAMQEGQVTHLGQTYPLPQPFWVLASQNPIELEGTFPLPEAQLDRFMFKLTVTTPDASALQQMLELTLHPETPELPTSAIDNVDLAQIMQSSRQVLVAQAVREAAVALVVATQPGAGGDPRIRYGVSPRGLQCLVRSAQANAIHDGRSHVALEDLGEVCAAVFRHRLLLSHEAELEGITPDLVVQDLLEQWQRQHRPA